MFSSLSLIFNLKNCGCFFFRFLIERIFALAALASASAARSLFKPATKMSRRGGFIQKTVTFQSTEARYGSKERAAFLSSKLSMSPALAQEVKENLNYFKDEDNETEKLTTLTFQLIMQEKGEGSAHSGIAPKFCLASVGNMAYRLQNKDKFPFFVILNALPCGIDELKQWFNHRPVFHQWASSRCLFAEWNKTTKAFNYSDEGRDMKRMDYFDLACGIISGTLNTIYTGNKDNGSIHNLESTASSAVSSTGAPLCALLYKFLMSESNGCWGAYPPHMVWNTAYQFIKTEHKDKNTVGAASVIAGSIVGTVKSILGLDTGNNKETVEKIIELFSKRDEQGMNAQHPSKSNIRAYYDYYRSFESPEQWLTCFAQAIKEHPYFLHKSSWPRLDYFLVGLLAAPVSVLASLEQEILEAVFTQAAEKVRKLGEELTLFMELEPMVRFIHTKTPNLANVLRYYAFIVNAIRLAKLPDTFGHRSAECDFATKLMQIREEVLECNSLPGLCQMIAPKAFLTNEAVAEIILMSSQRSSDSKEATKIMVKLGSFVDSGNADHANNKPVLETNWPTLHQQLGKNRATIQSLRDELKEKEEKAAKRREETEIANKAMAEQPAAIVTVAEESNKQQPNEHELARNLAASIINSLGGDAALRQNVRQLRSWVCETAMRGDAYAREELEAVRTTSHLCGARWFRVHIVHAVQPGSVCFEFYENLFEEVEKDYFLHVKTQPQRRCMRILLSRLHLASTGVSTTYGNLSRNNQTKMGNTSCGGEAKDVVEEDVSNAPVAKPIELVPWDCAFRSSYLLRRVYGAKECAICLRDNVKVFALHGDKRHGVCTVCETKLKAEDSACPFCRASLTA